MFQNRFNPGQSFIGSDNCAGQRVEAFLENRKPDADPPEQEDAQSHIGKDGEHRNSNHQVQLAIGHASLPLSAPSCGVGFSPRFSSSCALAFLTSLLLAVSASAQLNQNCTVSVLNRTVPVKPDGFWVLPNIPANFGQVKARATCTQNGVTTFGESAFFNIPANGAVNLPAIPIGNTTQIPTSLAIAPAAPSLTTARQTVQLIVTATYPNNSTKNVTSATTGTNYTISNPAIATITASGLVTAVTSGTVVIQANNDGATAISTVSVLLGGANVGGIPVSWLIAHNQEVSINKGINFE